MIRIRQFITRLRSDHRGAAAIEFALIGPAMITMLFGVLQVGIALQNYNALRSASADVARYAVVQYQRKQDPNAQALANYAKSTTTLAPYGLKAERLVIVINDKASTMTGVTEREMVMSYAIPSFMSIIGMRDINITYTRPIFLITN